VFEERCLLAAIEYLDRNDFTDIKGLDPHLIEAKDGKCPVVVWVTIKPPFIGRIPPELFDTTIPAKVIQLARTGKARVDTISFMATVPHGEPGYLVHTMNVLEQ
jgi:hypothetical protein